jgi:hypothetical protein
MLSQGADPHFEDAVGLDCCDKAKGIYPHIKEF